VALSLASVEPEQAARATEKFVSVIVQGFSADGARQAVESVGGRVTTELPIVDGVAAEVEHRALDALRSTRGVRAVTPNAPVRLLGKPGPKPTPSPSPTPTPSRAPIYQTTNSDDLWAQGYNGAGVRVAILDTGVYRGHPDLQGPSGSRVVHCEDFTEEAIDDGSRHTVCEDTFGHGTFMAGLVAGNGASSSGAYRGSAPAADIVSIKIAGFDGSADISKVLAGIQWAVAFKDTYGIRVLNLSLGTNSNQDYRLSPLNYAVERAWQAGIVVVVAAGNMGPAAQTIMKPADDPYVITVGASSDMGTSPISDDVVAAFSGRGRTRSNNLAKPDVVAPGMHTVSLRSPGSATAQKFPGSAIGDYYFKGSGSSMATAVVSGIVAQMLQRDPTLTPDNVKNRLVKTSRSIATTDPTAVGAGLVDAYAAATKKLPSVTQTYALSTGLGTLAADRGTISTDTQSLAGPVTLTGEFVGQTTSDPLVGNVSGLVPFSAANWTASNWTASNWTASNWTGSNWTASNWTASNWTASNWTATDWTGSNWTGSNWTNDNWQASNWTASNWTGSNWTASNWTASNWTSAWYAAAWD
jgi:serine protease AprX